ncbi:MAG: outer membrane lipoprotein carrier protein LolA [Bombella apis]|uniref:LolA family protein n=1 Tax=Bombella apis TaxID=1785988 RepID=UPI0023EF872B|nr:outer membrane lipoprotein carrier protein LolA [Bombella apis]MCT6818972.1 outer membrane lipoprotein carrier protein LolA [Bombella apis]
MKRMMAGSLLFWAGMVAAPLAVSGLTGCATSGYDHLVTNDRHDIHRVETYLNGLSSLQASFVQDGPAQQQGDGHFTYVPGRFEMLYEVPHAMRAVARDGRFVLRNADNGAVTHLSLKRNPLGLLLRHPVSFDRDVQVTNVSRGTESLQLSVAEADNPSQGLLTLQFSDVRGHLTLVGIQGVDARHHHFGLSLFDVQENQPVSESSFSLPE